MAPRPLYRRHDPAARTRYESLKQLARTQQRVLRGTPGTLKQRTLAGNGYWVREYIRVDGRKVDEYLGPASRVTDARVTAAKEEIDLARSLATGSAHLRLNHYQRIDRQAAVVLEVLHNRGLTEAGLVLVGSHAYGALLNELGVIAPGYRTQGIDLARGEPLKLAPEEPADLGALLLDTGMRFVPVPGTPAFMPSTKYRLPEADSLAVDLLVPGEAGLVVAVDELSAYAQAIPLLDYLVDAPVAGVVLSPNQVIPARLPAPARFVVHKLFSSQSRRKQQGKTGKDLEQAAVLAAALEEESPGAVAEAFDQLPVAGRAGAKRGARAAAAILAGHHAEAEALLRKLAKA